MKCKGTRFKSQNINIFNKVVTTQIQNQIQQMKKKKKIFLIVCVDI